MDDHYHDNDAKPFVLKDPTKRVSGFAIMMGVSEKDNQKIIFFVGDSVENKFVDKVVVEWTAGSEPNITTKMYKKHDVAYHVHDLIRETVGVGGATLDIDDNRGLKFEWDTNMVMHFTCKGELTEDEINSTKTQIWYLLYNRCCDKIKHSAVCPNHQ